jgi:hypothetical protein
LVSAQNLVRNPDFEEMPSCPYNPIYSFLSDTSYLYINHWFTPSSGTPDLFASCFYDSVYFANNCVPETYYTYDMTHNVPGNFIAFQYPKNGNNYIGFTAYIPNQNNYGNEYIGTELISSLVSGKKYCMDAYLSLADARIMTMPYLCSPPPPENYYTTCLALDRMQVYMAPSAIPYQNSFQPLQYLPQIELRNDSQTYLNDTINWMHVSGEYIASGG